MPRVLGPRLTLSRLLAFLLSSVILLASFALGAFIVSNYLTSSRGVEPRSAPPVLGTNVALEEYSSDADLERALAMIKDAHLTAIRQHFPWREIEATRGTFDWAKWDRIVGAASDAGLQIVAVLDTAPEWAQRDYERDLPNAPPDDFANYAAFAGAFAGRYGTKIHLYQIWDEPNVHPRWGRRNADPSEYARLLHLAAAAIRPSDPKAQILLAGLGMNLETQRPHPDYSEVLFLRGLYEAGAQKDFDIVAAKPYGMWSGPEDRRVSSNTLNFSRVILIRDEMKAYGDTSKPIWAVEMGWNALPTGWEGDPSPWGSDTEEVQSDRLLRGLSRAQSEWGWMGGIFPMMLSPTATATDPRNGLALTGADFPPRLFYINLASFAAHPPPLQPPPSPPLPMLAFLALVAIGSGWQAARVGPWAEVLALWRGVERRVHSLPESVQFASMAVVLAAFYYVHNIPLSLLLLALLALLFALRLDLGLVLAAFTIPFFLQPKTFGGLEFSLIEILTLVGVAAWIWRPILRGIELRAIPLRIGLQSIDWAVLLFVALGIVSIRMASNFGVAAREFRVIVIEPALFYFLIRATSLTRAQILRIMNALLAAGAVVCLIGLYQFVRGDVIRADTLGRIYAVWGSPNNAALFLGRLFPIAFSFALFLAGHRTRWLYAALVALLGITLFLTFSRGALFFGLPASLAVLALLLWYERRDALRISRVWLAAGVVLLIVVAAALLSTARVQSMFQEGTGTGFFRVAVWTSALGMIRDHPLFGVGLDNFLYEYPKYILPEAWREPNLSHPHNVFLDFWVRLGLIGPVVLVWLEVEFFRRGWRLFRTGSDVYIRALAAGLLAGMADFIAHGMIDAAYFVVDLAFVFMLSFGAIMALSRDSTVGETAPPNSESSSFTNRF